MTTVARILAFSAFFAAAVFADGDPVGYVKIGPEHALPREEPVGLKLTPAEAATLLNNRKSGGKGVYVYNGQEFPLDHVLAGRITDESGRPLAGAKIAVGTVIHYETETFKGGPTWTLHAESDAAGNYRVEDLPESLEAVHVSAPGRVTEIVEEISPAEDKCWKKDFVLKPGKTIRLRFEDAGGNPVPNVSVGLPRTGQPRYHASEAADKDGRWSWDLAREEGEEIAFRYYADKVGRGQSRKYFSWRPVGDEGDSPRYERHFLPREEEYVVKMTRFEVPGDKVFLYAGWGGRTGWDLPEKMRFHVVDSENRPIPDATCRVEFTDNLGIMGGDTLGPDVQKYLASVRTDEKGVVTVDFGDYDPERADFLQITIAKPGFVAMGHAWRSDWIRGGTHRGGEMYENATVVLTPGKTLSGRVVDEAGKTLPGVRVHYTFGSYYNDGGALLPLGEATVETDTEGRWTIADATKGRASIDFTHPDCAGVQQTVSEENATSFDGYANYHQDGETVTMKLKTAEDP